MTFYVEFVYFSEGDINYGVLPGPYDSGRMVAPSHFVAYTGPTRKHAGTGLGLVICRGIIDAHGGKIWVDNTCKTGAAIKFTLPVRGQEVIGKGIQAHESIVDRR